jgi:hypothetical protein
VGAYAVQLASHAGATVIATASGDDEAYLRSIGASRVIDYREEQFDKALREKVDVVFNLIRGDTQKIFPGLEGRRLSRLCHRARVAGRVRDAPCVRRDDEARTVRGDARQNRAAAGSRDDTTRRRNRVRAPRCGPGLEGHRQRTGAPYDNRFVSIITVADRKIVHWRDYMDSLAAWNALNPRSS